VFGLWICDPYKNLTKFRFTFNHKEFTTTGHGSKPFVEPSVNL
jgi:hypothetical protein